MLKSVHDMISAQKQCMEAASLILEAGKSLDDIIVLGEAAPGPVPPPTDETEPVDPAVENPDDAGGAEPDGDPDTVPSEEPLDGPAEGPEGGEEPLPVPGADDLPEPVGKQTGETPISADDDLLNMQVNLGSNTLRDVLPQPPANAADAIGDEDDIMNTRVDAGFGGDEGGAGGDDFTDPANPPVPQSDVPADPTGGPEVTPGPDDGTPVDNGGEGGPEGTPNPPVEEESGDLLSGPMDDINESAKKVTGKAKENIAAGLEDKIKNCNNQVKLSDLDDSDADKKKDGKSFSEAITMDDGGGSPPAAGSDANAQPAAGGDDGITEPPVDTGDVGGGDAGTAPAAEEPAPENDVTAAVKDKVAEVSGPTPGTSTTTEDLLNKLSNVTKNIEDIKKGLVASGIGTMNV